MDKQGRIDKFLKKWTSRKLMVFAIASISMFLGLLQASEWVSVALAYIGMQGVADIAATYRFGKKEKDSEI